MTTNPSKTEEATQEKYSDPTRIVSDIGAGRGSATFAAVDPRRLDLSDAGSGQSSSVFAAIDPRRLDLKIPEGAEKPEPPPTQTNVSNIMGSSISDDLRVRIRVPSWYITKITEGFGKEVSADGNLRNLNGIIFPYTPSITYSVKADYANQNPTHSNFALYFYQRSSVSSISIQGKFTVENYRDAVNYLSTVRLLKALTRMRFGPDPDAGAPPPVCRLDGYGKMMLKNVPVVIQEFRVELPDGVDYFRAGPSNTFELNMVPTVSTLQVTCLPMYSRRELQGFSVNSYISNTDTGGFV